MPQLAMKSLSWFQTNPQVRKQFDEEELRRLGASLKVKQLQPVLCQPDGTIIAGERRYRAAMLVGMIHLEAKIADEQLSESEIRIWQLTENMQREDLSGYEKWMGCAELMCMNPGWSQRDLAEQLHVSESMIVRLLSPSKCSGEWQDALKNGEVGISDCYAASKLPLAEQPGLLALKLSGASRDAIESAGRKSRNGHASVVRASRIKCLLTGGVSIVASGDALSLDDLIEALAEAGKEARKARDQGLDARTFQAILRDKAKAG